MLLHTVDLPSSLSRISIKVISDTHIGDPLHNSSLLNADINWALSSPSHFLILNGDILNIATTSSLSDTYTSTLTPHEELKVASQLFMPAKSRILSCTQGNHERRIHRQDGFDISEMLAEALSAPYAPDSIILKIRFGQRQRSRKKQVYTLFHTHGSTSSRTVGGKANRLENLRTITITDIYVVSHSHEPITFKRSVFVPDLHNDNIIEKQQTFVNTGAYMDYGGYAERKSYSPAPPGTPEIQLYGAEKRTDVVM